MNSKKKYKSISYVCTFTGIAAFIWSAIHFIQSGEKENGGLGGLNELILAIQGFVVGCILVPTGIVLLLISNKKRNEKAAY